MPRAAVPPRPCSNPPWIDLYERFEQSDGPIEQEKWYLYNQFMTTFSLILTLYSYPLSTFFSLHWFWQIEREKKEVVSHGCSNITTLEQSSKVDDNDIKTKNKGCNLMIGSKCIISVMSNHPKIKSDIEFKIERYIKKNYCNIKAVKRLLVEVIIRSLEWLRCDTKSSSATGFEFMWLWVLEDYEPDSIYSS